MSAKGPFDVDATYGVLVDDSASTRVVGIFGGRPASQDMAVLTLGQGVRHLSPRSRRPDGGITVYEPF